MGIVDDYLNSPSSKEKSVPIKGSGLIEQYLNTKSETTPSNTKVIVHPPISDIDTRTSTTVPADYKYVNPPATSPEWEAIKATPGNILNDSIENFKNAGGMIGKGGSELLSNKPASGVGNIGLGVVSGIGAIPGAFLKNLVEKPVTELTGNPDIGERAGVVAGVGLPIIPAAKAITAAIPKNKALRTLVESIGQDNLPNVVQQMKENPRLTPADLSPRVKQDTQNLFVTEGPHQNYLANVVEQRLNTAKNAVENAMDKSLGTVTNPADKLAELKQNIRDVGASKINPAVTGAKPVDLSDTIKYIDQRLKPGINSVVDTSGGLPSTEVNKQLGQIRSLLTNDKVVRTDAKTLHNLQSVMRGEAEGLIKNGGQDARVGNAIMGVRNQIVDAIDSASGGKYKPALSEYRDEYHIQDAYRHGHDEILRNGKELEDRPEFYQKYLNKLSPEELQAEREGARIAYDTQVNGFKHAARRGTDIGEVEFNKDRAEALFGKAKADEMFKTFKDERAIADTNNKLVQGSQTAMRMASKQAFALPTASDMTKSLIPPAALEVGSAMAGGTPIIPSLVYGGLKGAGLAKDKIALALTNEHNAKYAKYALPTEGPDRDALIQQLDAIANRPPKQSLLSRVSRLIPP